MRIPETGRVEFRFTHPLLAGAAWHVVKCAVGEFGTTLVAVELDNSGVDLVTKRPYGALRMKHCPPMGTPARKAAWVELVTSVRDALCAVEVNASAKAYATVEPVVQAAFRKFAAGFYA